MSDTIRRPRRPLGALLAVGTLAALALTATPAAADFTAHKDSFDGTGSASGPFVRPEAIAVNIDDRSVLVVDPGKAAPLSQFNMDGTPKPFSALGSNTAAPFEVGGNVDVEVDNSGGPGAGRIYVASESPGQVYAFEADGTPIGGNFPLVGPNACAVALDHDGDLWVSYTAIGVEYTLDGNPTGATAELGGCHIGFNSDNDPYFMFVKPVTGHGEGTMRYGRSDGTDWGDLIFAQGWGGFTFSRANDDIFINNETEIVQVSKTHQVIERFGTAEDFAPFYPGLVQSDGIAYDPVTDVTYAPDHGVIPARVEMFGKRPPLPPKVKAAKVIQVRSTSVVLATSINPNGGETKYAIEYGTTGAYGSMVGPADGSEPKGREEIPGTISIEGLQPGTQYHFRLVAENSADRTEGVDQTFITYEPSPGVDTCDNALARKQTGAGALADCRAYELASAVDTAGYNVSSDLVPGEAPLPGFPMASGPSKLLYTLESGSIPGTGVPTSFPEDPYVATRTVSGWTTEYVGIPSNVDDDSFASSFSAASERLQTFAFDREDLCSPCFADGKSGIPVRRPDGTLVQGMAGSLDPGPGSSAEVLVRRRLSADGTHLVFASTDRFEDDAPAAGQPAVYLRDLAAGSTRVVSKDDAGANIACLSECATKGVAALDVSRDGSRVVVGQLTGSGPGGVDLWHPYLNVGPGLSVDLLDGAAGEVIYNGMTADGSRVFFTSFDQLTVDDGDSSLDLYRADVSGGDATLTRLSAGPGSVGNEDNCEPVPDAVHERWNGLDSAADCDVVAVAGGGGIGTADGSIYFLSPERLTGAGDGVEDAPNLYLAAPDGGLTFVATLDSELNIPLQPRKTRKLVTEITGFDDPGHLAADPDLGYVYVVDWGADVVYRFDSEGNPAPFSTVAPYIEGNKITGTEEFGPFAFDSTSGIAVDDSEEFTEGWFYVADTNNTNRLQAFLPSGEHVGQMPADFAPGHVSVAPNGKVMSSGFGGTNMFTVTGLDTENAEREFAAGFASYAGVANDNDFYYWLPTLGGPVRQYPMDEFDQGYSPRINFKVADSAMAIGREANSSDYLIDRGDRIDQYNVDRKLTVAAIGAGELVDSRGVAAIANGPAFASDLADDTVKIYGSPVPFPDPEVTSTPIAVNGVEDPGTYHPEDIQVEPSGGSAAFVSTMPLNGDVVGQVRQVFRYDAPSGELACASCNLTRLEPTDGARLSAHGSNMATGGRVFFSTAEPLALRDANGREDVYQWSADEGYQLVSPGNSQFDNTLLSVSWDGIDAYFFTRNNLVPEDRNGEQMKIYDARADGGFFRLPARVPCAAADECRGPSSQPPAKLAVGTVTGVPGNARKPKRKCRKGKVLRKGKCRARKAKRSRRARKRARAKAKQRRGNASAGRRGR